MQGVPVEFDLRSYEGQLDEINALESGPVCVMRGEPAVPRQFVSRLIDELRGRERRRHLTLPDQRRVELTAREWQVVELLQQQLPTGKIAAELGISQVTVRRHLSAVAAKLGVSSRSEVLDLLG